MPITKSEAIVYLALMTSRADGDFSNEEIRAVMDAMPKFYMTVKEINSNDSFKLKKISGELNEQSAIEALDKLPESDRIEALAVCWLIANSDNIIKPGEQEFLDSVAKRLEIDDFDKVVKKARRLSRSTNIVYKALIVAAAILGLYFLLSYIASFYN